MRSQARRQQEGAATVILITVLATLLAVVGLVVSVQALVVTRHRAETAADLAALSAARHVLEGEDAACAVAGSVARRHGARLDECLLVDLDVHVRVSRPAPGRFGGLGRLAATARAGAR